MHRVTLASFAWPELNNPAQVAEVEARLSHMSSLLDTRISGQCQLRSSNFLRQKPLCPNATHRSHIFTLADETPASDFQIRYIGLQLPCKISSYFSRPMQCGGCVKELLCKHA
ncbi:hypothetical protein VFPPC_16762 [Pochonia chlamydosporia 170]|uniref:Uncharacterized protein n=1 Tax=Pochonia chlamydosporia 170 TaxID=1380566 RepID=A0A179F6E2_METCM|nr:hypothetical protein VFPPC_16762 [Pochonia chlamydosporia 170]OAQ60723.1 hypothetical protein VFPPC_16762 [Pochonia chlamydosporia 170]